MDGTVLHITPEARFPQSVFSKNIVVEDVDDFYTRAEE